MSVLLGARKVGPHFFYKLYCFHFVAHFGSYNRAALHLNLTQAPLSRAIQSLEFALNGRLLHRKTRSTLRLSDEGLRVFEWSTQLLRILEGLSEKQEPTRQEVLACGGFPSDPASTDLNPDLGRLFEALADYFNTAESGSLAINGLCQHLKQHSCQRSIKPKHWKPD